MLILAKNAEIMLLRFYFKFSNKKKTHQIYPFLTSTNFKSAYSLCDNLTIKNNQTINNQHLHAILGNRSSYGQAFISVAYIQTPPPPLPPSLRRNQPCGKSLMSRQEPIWSRPLSVRGT